MSSYPKKLHLTSTPEQRQSSVDMTDERTPLMPTLTEARMDETLPLLTPIPILIPEDRRGSQISLANPSWTSSWRWGLFMATLSGFLFTSSNFFVQFFQVDALEMLLVRSVTQSIVFGTVVINDRVCNGPSSSSIEKCSIRMYILLQATFCAFRLFFDFLCLAYMPLGDALTLTFTEPLFTLLLSRLFLKISITIWKIVLCIGLLAGLVLCIQPPFIFPIATMTVNETLNSTIADSIVPEQGSDSYYTGAGLAIACAICGSFCNIILSKCHGVKMASLVFHAGILGIVVSVVGSLIQTDGGRILISIESLQPQDWIVLIMISVLGVLAYVTMTIALRSVSPTSVSVLRSLQIILAYVCQIAFMGVIPNWLCVSGASLVIISVVGIAVEEKLKQNLNLDLLSNESDL